MTANSQRSLFFSLTPGKEVCQLAEEEGEKAGERRKDRSEDEEEV